MAPSAAAVRSSTKCASALPAMCAGLAGARRIRHIHQRRREENPWRLKAFRHRQPHGAQYEMPIADGAIRATELRKIKVDATTSAS